jgi:hypothetical protein
MLGMLESAQLCDGLPVDGRANVAMSGGGRTDDVHEARLA